MTAEEVYELVRKIRFDLTAAQSKLSSLFQILGELGLEDKPEACCAKCGLGFRGERTLAEHDYHSHDGPVPQHWLELDAAVVKAELERADDERRENEAFA